ncbi:Pre-rRNA-processing protein ipi3 [Gnomoniopsis smithogilvyi]|uniref:Pre-rRNA-processing protein IPI3 n=1 Tax=Gnomoniopsis smithogilvyi TaxID=1191159 RepID=A0A9W8YJ93_9PEZI|nr:Pre-rRNA-processing protein ipi3 [Gnomoniopsis smithogilvyi]
MIAEEFFSAVYGPPLSSNTAIAKDVGIYVHSLWPTFAPKSTFRKSAAPPHCLAVSDTHVFAAQHEKAYVHVYSRLRGNQEAFVALPEKIRSIALAGDVLILGTVEGRIMLWETCTGRLVSLPPYHVQAVSCIATTPYHLLTGSDDSNVHVWSLARLLEFDSNEEHEPTVSFSNHRGAITDLAVSSGDNPETSLCVSASKDKTCVIWNYRSGEVLRTLLFPTFPLCLALDPCACAVFVSTDQGSIYSVDFFGSKPLLGPKSEESSTVVQVTTAFCTAPAESGPATCLSLAHDGTTLLSGHPKGQIHAWSITDKAASSGVKELTNLNAAITNIVFVPPMVHAAPVVKAWTIVKPSQVQRTYSFSAQFEADLTPETRFTTMAKTPGFDRETLDSAISAFLEPPLEDSVDKETRHQMQQQWDIMNQLTASS